MNRKAHMV